MKKIILIMVTALYFTKTTRACDICGCSIAGSFNGILPKYQKNYIGIRHTAAAYTSQHPGETGINKDNSNSTELWGRFYPHHKVQIIASVPYNIKTSNNINTHQQSKGIGDASIQVNYKLVNRFYDTLLIQQLLMAGSGIKLPTGQYLIKDAGIDLPMALQPGSGSYDFIFNTLYIIRYKNWGLNTDINYRLTTSNTTGYAFGNKLTTSLRTFYNKTFNKNCNLLVSSGVLHETMGKNYQNGYVITETGGVVNSISNGCELYYKSFQFSAYYNFPFQQNISQHQTINKHSFQLSTGLLF